MTRYVIYLYSHYRETHADPRIGNEYGYFTGKQYSVNYEQFPICTGNEINEKTKTFKSKLIAINSAEKCYDKFGYVADYDIEEVFMEEV